MNVIYNYFKLHANLAKKFLFKNEIGTFFRFILME